MFAWADALRRQHYPPERNRLAAHVTLFHALPPSADAEVRQLLADVAAASAPPPARIAGIMDLGQGTALAVDSPAMTVLHAGMADRLHGILQQRDVRPLRLHITIQNRVARAAARALQDDLAGEPHPRDFRFRALGLYAWDGAMWRSRKDFPFRGQA